MQVKVWGCRGSVPTPGAETVGYGGNTSCVEVSLDDGTSLILDAGTGILGLGVKLSERLAHRLHLFLTHLHLDHLEGLRFFAPLWDERVTLDIWGPPSPVLTLEERIRRSFSPPLFPIDLRTTPADVTFRDVPREPWSIGGATLTAELVMHPGPTVGYRIEANGSTFAYLPDHEPALTGITNRPLEWVSGASIAVGADLLVHDAQYSASEYPGKIGWGHSSADDAVAYMHVVGARRLVLFHHDPSHNDESLGRIEARARELADGDGARPTAAREGMVFDVV